MKNNNTGEMAKLNQIKNEDNKSHGKNLNQRIEDLVIEMEKSNNLLKKTFSIRASFLRGLLQGLGIVIGSTILAGFVYSLTVKVVGPEFIKESTLQYLVDQENLK